MAYEADGILTGVCFVCLKELALSVCFCDLRVSIMCRLFG